MANEIKDITVTKTAADIQDTDWFEGQTAAGGTGSSFKIAKSELVPDAASAISFTPAGNIAATDVQAAIEELDSEKASTAYADAKVADAINNGTTTVAPSQNAVFDALALKLNKLITTRTVIATHELDATDLASINAGDQLEILLNSASPLTLEIPTNAVQAFPTGTVIGGQQYGAGQVTIAPDATVTMRSPNAANKSFAQYSKFFLEKIGTNEWVLSGDITV